LVRPWRRVDRKLHAILIRLSAGLRLNRYTTSPYSPLEQVAGGYQPVLPTLYRSCCSIPLTRPRSSSQMAGKSHRRPPTIGFSLIVLQSSILTAWPPLLLP
jgi:hypothetical protein